MGDIHKTLGITDKSTTMRAAIYNPYFDTLGGGERYTASVIKALLEKGFDVDVEWNDPGLNKKLRDRFGIIVDNARVVPSIERGDGYDLTFWVSDGSIPTLKSRKNILHFQVPFQKVGGSTLLSRMKMFRIDHVVCNSYFTKGIIDKEFSVNSKVLYPPVDLDIFKSKRKENIILYVGRFSKLKQAKRQDVLIRAFKEMYDSGTLKNWKMILAGGAEVGDDDFSYELKKESETYPIRFIKSPGIKDLVSLYASARLYWSASGFGVDEIASPDKVEHFGLSVVEAMASGCVPLVFDSGGHREIVSNGADGFLWKNEQELKSLTEDVLKSRHFLEIVKKAKSKSEQFSYSKFVDTLFQFI